MSNRVVLRLMRFTRVKICQTHTSLPFTISTLSSFLSLYTSVHVGHNLLLRGHLIYDIHSQRLGSDGRTGMEGWSVPCGCPHRNLIALASSSILLMQNPILWDHHSSSCRTCFRPVVASSGFPAFFRIPVALLFCPVKYA